MAVKTSPPDTGTGVALPVWVPSPSIPVELSPQQYPTPAAVTPQTWRFPTLRLAKINPPANQPTPAPVP